MKTLPKAVIVGFPNVGKSTLFNRLLGEKKSLVHSMPGMTRDNVAAFCRLEDKPFQLVDTGGIFGTREEALSEKVREKAWAAARAADMILFVLDGKRDLSPVEEDFYFSLKKLDLPVLVVVNKVDSPAGEDRMAEWYRLGDQDIIPVSAEHNINVDELKRRIALLLPVRSLRPEQTPLKIAVVGRINVGKSSLVNRLSGEEKLLVSDLPGTTRDSTDTLILRGGKSFCLVDTAGIRKFRGADDSREKAGIIRAKRNIRDADVIALILDAEEFPTRQDTHIAHLARDSGKPLMIALNKWDLMDAARIDPERIRRRVFAKLGFVSYAPLLFVSARTGQRVVKILDLATTVFKNGQKRISTSRLNEFLAWINERHPPKSRDGSRIKIKYMTQQGILPPAFVLFGHSKTSLSPAYEKAFLDYLRGKFDFQGTPLRLFLRQS